MHCCIAMALQAPVYACVEEEEEKRKFWDSLRNKYQQKTRAKVAPLKAWNKKQEQWEVQVLLR